MHLDFGPLWGVVVVVGAVMSMMVVVMQGVLVLPVVIVIGGGRGCDGGGGVWQCLMVDMVGCMCGLWWFVLVRSKSSMCSCCAIRARSCWVTGAHSCCVAGAGARSCCVAGVDI